MFGDFGKGCVLGRVAASTRKTYDEANSRMWVSWRTHTGKGILFDAEMGEAGMVEELVQYMVFCCAVKRKVEATVARKLEAINFHHEL